MVGGRGRMDTNLAFWLLCAAAAHLLILLHWDGFSPVASMQPGPIAVRLTPITPEEETQPSHSTQHTPTEPPITPMQRPVRPRITTTSPQTRPAQIPIAAATTHASTPPRLQTPRKTTTTTTAPLETSDRTQPSTDAQKPTTTTTYPPKPTAHTPIPSNAALLALIHRAVEKRKHYPRRAQRRGQEGRTVIRFTVSPDGAISDLNIRHSSGHRLLDQAATHAVQGIAPLTGVERYLNQTQTLELGIAFRLREPRP